MHKQRAILPNGWFYKLPPNNEQVRFSARSSLAEKATHGSPTQQKLTLHIKEEVKYYG